METRPWATASLVVLLVAAPVQVGAPPPPDAPLCGTRPVPPPVWEHVVWIWFENHGFGAIVGSREARNINRRLIPSCGLATNYHSLAHPSLPNYIAATSGLPLGALGPLRDNCNATGPCHTNAPSIFAQAPTWGAYAESMPRACTHWFTGAYAANHNPAVYYSNLRDCRTNVVNLRALRPALESDTLPRSSSSRRTCATACTTARSRRETSGSGESSSGSPRARPTSAAPWRSSSLSTRAPTATPTTAS